MKDVEQRPERSTGERRNGERRGAARGGLDRRRVQRRAAGVALAVTSLLASATPVRANVYTRVNSKGVLEATNVPAVPESYKLTYRSKGTLVHSAGFRESASTNTQFDAHIEAAAARYGVSRVLVRAIIQVESAFDSLAVSTAGARGLMQLMPATARRFGVTDSFNAGQNIFAGTRYLRILLDRYAGDVSLAAAAYNAGETAVSRHNGIPPYPETQTYVRRVNALLGHTMDAPASVTPAILPGPGDQRATKAPSARPVAHVVKTPRVYYRWTDAKGVVHMEQTAPTTGEYTTIRSRD
jgi:Transglycosylase SLT domain